jgi:hypothetical protein
VRVKGRNSCLCEKIHLDAFCQLKAQLVRKRGIPHDLLILRQKITKIALSLALCTEYHEDSSCTSAGMMHDPANIKMSVVAWFRTIGTSYRLQRPCLFILNFGNAMIA